MNYLQKNDRRNRKPFIKWSVFLAIVFLILIFSTNLSGFASKSLNSLAYPFWKVKNSLLSDNSRFLAFFTPKVKLTEEVSELKQKLLSAELKLKGMELIVKENEDLRSVVGREDLSESIPAVILARPPQIGYDFLIIDVGSENNLKIGQKVFFESILLGEIVEIFEKTSKVKLLSAPGSEIVAFIERINLPVKVEGRGWGNFESNVPKIAPVEVGDVLVVLGSSRKFIGQVEFIEDEPAKSFKRILFKFPINLSELRWVSVEKTVGIKNEN